jgi:hypothetical protein
MKIMSQPFDDYKSEHAGTEYEFDYDPEYNYDEDPDYEEEQE